MRLAVVGTGLMGASVGLAAKRAGVDTVAGYDADEAPRVAAERGAVDEPADSMEAAVAEADLVVVAVPVNAARLAGPDGARGRAGARDRDRRRLDEGVGGAR